MFRFDRADGYWLQGYAKLLMALVDFWLAHDFRNAFDASFQMLFPRAGLPLQEALVPPADLADPGMLLSEWRMADFVSFFHLDQLAGGRARAAAGGAAASCSR